MLNTRLSVAIHILALVSDDPSRSSREMAESVNTNPVVIRRISGDLKNAGILTSRAGTKGYNLVKAPADITLLDIYRAIELENLIFPVHNNPNPNCPIGKNIQETLDSTFDSIQVAIENELQSKTLATVLATLQLA